MRGPAGELQGRPAGNYAARRQTVGERKAPCRINRQGAFLCAGPRRRRGKCVKILLPETEPKGLAGSGEQTAPGKKRRASSPEIPGPRFAPENRNRGDEREPWWPPGLQPRNPRPEVRARKPKAGRRARTMPAAGPPTPKSPARGSRPKTESGKTSANHGGRRASNSEILGPRFASENRKQRASGEPSANRAGRRASNLETPGPRFAPGNRNRGDESEPCRPPGLQLRNSRPEVRARKPKPRSRARTMAAAGPPADPSPCPAGPLCLLKDLQVCPEGLPTKPAGMPGRPNPPGPPRLSTGPASFPGGLISLPAGPIKNAGRPPGVFSLSSYLIIYSSGLRSIPLNPSRYAFSSGSTSAMPPSWVASTFSGSTGSCRDFRRRNQPV